MRVAFRPTYVGRRRERCACSGARARWPGKLQRVRRDSAFGGGAAESVVDGVGEAAAVGQLYVDAPVAGRIELAEFPEKMFGDATQIAARVERARQAVP